MIKEEQEHKEEAGLSIGFVALFFGKTVSWLRWCENRGYFVYPDGTPITPSRYNRNLPEDSSLNLNNRRQYTYQNIVDMADSLLRLKRITDCDHSRIITRVSIMQN